MPSLLLPRSILLNTGKTKVLSVLPPTRLLGYRDPNWDIVNRTKLKLFHWYSSNSQLVIRFLYIRKLFLELFSSSTVLSSSNFPIVIRFLYWTWLYSENFLKIVKLLSGFEAQNIFSLSFVLSHDGSMEIECNPDLVTSYLATNPDLVTSYLVTNPDLVTLLQKTICFV